MPENETPTSAPEPPAVNHVELESEPIVSDLREILDRGTDAGFHFAVVIQRSPDESTAAQLATADAPLNLTEFAHKCGLGLKSIHELCETAMDAATATNLLEAFAHGLGAVAVHEHVRTTPSRSTLADGFPRMRVANG